MAWQVGQTITWGLRTYNDAGVLADVGGGVPAGAVTLPDGTTASATVVKTATGTYSASIVGTMAGRWPIVWTGSGANSAGLPWSDVADVYDAARLIIPLGEARNALNIPAAVVVNDTEILGHILAAADLVEAEIGPVLPRTIVETHVLWRPTTAVVLHETAASITGVTIDGEAVPAGQWQVEAGSVLRRGTTGLGGVWWGTVVVTYTVGVSVLPAALLDAAKLIVQHRYQQEQQRQRPGLGSEAGAAVPLGFAVPSAALDLLRAAPVPPQPAGMA
jgi:hypothetical protein